MRLPPAALEDVSCVLCRRKAQRTSVWLCQRRLRPPVVERLGSTCIPRNVRQNKGSLGFPVDQMEEVCTRSPEGQRDPQSCIPGCWGRRCFQQPEQKCIYVVGTAGEGAAERGISTKVSRKQDRWIGIEHRQVPRAQSHQPAHFPHSLYPKPNPSASLASSSPRPHAASPNWEGRGHWPSKQVQSWFLTQKRHPVSQLRFCLQPQVTKGLSVTQQWAEKSYLGQSSHPDQWLSHLAVHWSHWESQKWKMPKPEPLNQNCQRWAPGMCLKQWNKIKQQLKLTGWF